MAPISAAAVLRAAQWRRQHSSTRHKIVSMSRYSRVIAVLIDYDFNYLYHLLVDYRLYRLLLFLMTDCNWLIVDSSSLTSHCCRLFHCRLRRLSRTTIANDDFWHSQQSSDDDFNNSRSTGQLTGLLLCAECSEQKYKYIQIYKCNEQLIRRWHWLLLRLDRRGARGAIDRHRLYCSIGLLFSSLHFLAQLSSALSCSHNPKRRSEIEKMQSNLQRGNCCNWYYYSIIFNWYRVFFCTHTHTTYFPF